MTISHRPTPGSALWVYAHPRRPSLNDRLFQEGVQELSAYRQVATSDLYAQGFDPVLGRRDLGARAEEPGNIAEQIGQTYALGHSPADVSAEQAKLAAAELLVIQFPLWWYGPPAILKGWFDRVLTSEFAYGDADPERGVPRRYGDGGLSGRKALVVVTAGEDARSVGPRGISGDLESLLFPITHGVLWYVGIETLGLHVVHDADAWRQPRVNWRSSDYGKGCAPWTPSRHFLSGVCVTVSTTAPAPCAQTSCPAVPIWGST